MRRRLIAHGWTQNVTGPGVGRAASWRKQAMAPEGNGVLEGYERRTGTTSGSYGRAGPGQACADPSTPRVSRSHCSTSPTCTVAHACASSGLRAAMAS